jgi:hypothetical protein
MASSFGSYRLDLGRRARFPTTTVFSEIAHQPVHVFEVRGIEDESPFLAAADEAGPREVGEME